MWFIKILKSPLWLLKLFIKKPKKRKNELEEKQRKHVRNFDPTRLKNRSWQISIGKDKRKKKRFSKKKVKSKQ